MAFSLSGDSDVQPNISMESSFLITLGEDRKIQDLSSAKADADTICERLDSEGK